MNDHRPASLRRGRLISTGAAAFAFAFAGVAGPADAAGAAASATGKAEAAAASKAKASATAKAKAKSRAAAAKRRRSRQTAAEPGVVVHWSGRVHSDAPEAPHILVEEWRLYTGTTNRAYQRITNTADARDSIESWDSETFGAAVSGPLDQPLAKRIARRSSVSLGCQGDHDSWGPQHEADLVTLYTDADELRRDDVSFAALPTGPEVNGRATRLAVIDPFVDNEPLQRDAGIEFLYDAQTRNVVRVRRAGGPGPADVWTEPEVWEVLPASKVTVPEAPAVLRTFC